MGFYLTCAPNRTWLLSLNVSIKVIKKKKLSLIMLGKSHGGVNLTEQGVSTYPQRTLEEMESVQ